VNFKLTSKVKQKEVKSGKSVFNFQKGFTLMEMLVVLILTGLISTLLIQGLTHVLGLRIRFLSQLEKQTTETLQAHWFREISRSLVPDHPSGKNIFSGTEQGFQGLSFASLSGIKGVPTPVFIELVYKSGNIFLQYKETNPNALIGDETFAAWEIARWTGHGGRFSYLDRSGRWHSHWPPPIDKSNQLPEGILLEADDALGKVNWFVSPAGRREPKPTLKDFLG
jgi:prepilin-type N-terminal cleavage/methylation domain-containing protein